MTSAQRAQLKKLLLALQEELSGKSPARKNANRPAEEPPVDKEDEQPLHEMLQAIASNRNRNADQTLALVDRALEKLEENPEEYGECEECGEDIAIGRLKSMPYAPFCVDCQAKRDAPRGGVRKRLTDYV